MKSFFLRLQLLVNLPALQRGETAPQPSGTHQDHGVAPRLPATKNGRVVLLFDARAIQDRSAQVAYDALRKASSDLDDAAHVADKRRGNNIQLRPLGNTPHQRINFKMDALSGRSV